MALKWAWPGVRDPISKFWDPSIFRKRKKLHVGLRSAGAGTYCDGHLAAQLVIYVIVYIGYQETGASKTDKFVKLLKHFIHMLVIILQYRVAAVAVCIF